MLWEKKTLSDSQITRKREHFVPLLRGVVNEQDRMFSGVWNRNEL